MIDPGIAMHDLDAGGWAWFTGLAAARDRDLADELHVLHESGRVLAAVRTTTGHLDELPVLDDDLAAAAERLRAEHRVARVVLVDADDLAPVREAESALGVKERTQPELLAGLQAAFWSSPGVVADPPPAPPGAWPQLFERLAARGDGSITLTSQSVRLHGRLHRGRLVEVTTLRQPPDDVVLALDLDDDELTELMHAPDVARAVLDWMDAHADR